jgi:hypothetical protein
LGVRRRAGAERCGRCGVTDVAGAMEIGTAGRAAFTAGGAPIGDAGGAADAASGAEAGAGATSAVGASVAAAGGLGRLDIDVEAHGVTPAPSQYR